MARTSRIAVNGEYAAARGERAVTTGGRYISYERLLPSASFILPMPMRM